MRVIQYILITGYLVASVDVIAQLSIGSATTAKVSGQITVRSNINNGSAQMDWSSAQINLVGTNQSLSTATPVTLQGLAVDGGGTKTITGEWTVTRTLNFVQGIVSTGGGKLIYTGSPMLTGSVNAFVNGILFQQGTGTRFYPVGTGNTYAPMAFSSVNQGNVELGVRVVASGPSLELPLDVSSIASNRYWEVSQGNGGFTGSAVSLYVPGSSVDGSQRLTVIEADNINGATAINIGGSPSNDFVTSFSVATKPILTIGIGDKVDFKIFDLISPYNADNINDQLHIVNVEYTAENKVTLLDRWGVVVKRWDNFRNYDDPLNPNQDGYDFSRLGPGNYICVFEYRLTPDGPKEDLTQMITVLKGE
jgi:hypothetical protein